MDSKLKEPLGPFINLNRVAKYFFRYTERGRNFIEVV